MCKEFILSFERCSAAKHNGAEYLRISEWEEGAKVPNRAGDAYRFVRGNKIYCPFCSTEEEPFASCEHAAIIKTWKRQGLPIARVYGIDDGKIYYWNKGQKITLSAVDQVNRG